MGRREQREQQRELAKLREKLKKLESSAPKQPWWKTTFSKTIVILGLVTASLTLQRGWFFFHPHVSIQPGQTLNSTNPFTTQFTVTNEGNFEVSEVTPICLIGEVKTTKNITGRGFSFPPSNKIIPRLTPQQKSTVECPAAISELGEDAGNVVSSDILMVVFYYQAWWPGRQNENYGFEGKVDSLGIVHWIPRTVSELDRIQVSRRVADSKKDQ